MIAFGPVPSRRLGKSLGINNIPPKICTYSCVYCQLGRTNNMQIERQSFYNTKEVYDDVSNKIKSAVKKDEAIDYLAFVSDGEPTLDINLGKEIKTLRSLGIKIAVITNSSLIWKKDVRDDLHEADWVSLKVDSISQDIWKKIDRPHGSLKLQKILDGILEFSNSFKGFLATETMLIQDINTTSEEVEKIANFIKELHAKKSYISIPIRPPAEKWAKTPEEKNLTLAYQIFVENNIPTEYLIGYEGNAFAYTGNIEEDLLSIMSVHPIREDGVVELLKKAKANWSIIESLIEQGKIIETSYKDNKFYMKKLTKNKD